MEGRDWSRPRGPLEDEDGLRETGETECHSQGTRNSAVKEAPSDPVPRFLEEAGSRCRRKALPGGGRQEPEIQAQRELGGCAGGNGRREGETDNPREVLGT